MTRRPEEPRPLLNGGAKTSADQAAARLLMRLPALREDQVARERIWRALGQAERRPRAQVWRPLAVGASGWQSSLWQWPSAPSQSAQRHARLELGSWQRLAGGAGG